MIHINNKRAESKSRLINKRTNELVPHLNLHQNNLSKIDDKSFATCHTEGIDTYDALKLMQETKLSSINMFNNSDHKVDSMERKPVSVDHAANNIFPSNHLPSQQSHFNSGKPPPPQQQSIQQFA